MKENGSVCDRSIKRFISQKDDEYLSAINVAVEKKDDRCLCIQGPLSAENTFTGKQAIAALVENGKRAGGAISNLHAAILNLLD